LLQGYLRRGRAFCDFLLRTWRADMGVARGVRFVEETVEYCGHLFALGDKRLSCFISPMGPFIDPGSRGFEEPERFGYRLFARTLEEHRRLLIQPTWEYILNYETRWMSRRELVDATYDAAERLNELKVQHGRLSKRRGRGVAQGIAAEFRG